MKQAETLPRLLTEQQTSVSLSLSCSFLRKARMDGTRKGHNLPLTLESSIDGKRATQWRDCAGTSD